MRATAAATPATLSPSFPFSWSRFRRVRGTDMLLISVPRKKEPLSAALLDR